MPDYKPVPLDGNRSLIWYEDLSEWRAYWPGIGTDLWSTSGWDTAKDGVLAFERGEITWSEKVPGA